MKNTRFILILALVVSLGLLVPGRAAVSQQMAGELFEKAIYVEEGQGDLQKAIGLFQDIVKRFPAEREIAANAQLHIGLCYEKLGLTEAQKAFQKVVSDFPEQAEAVTRAREKLSAMVRANAVLDTAEKALSVRLIWSGPDADSVGKASPDGKFLSFIDKETANLCIKELASGKTTVVTKKEPWGKSYEFAVSSCWSPDGKKLAFGWFNKDNSIELRTVDTDGSNVRILYQKKDEMVFPASWSPDGRSIAVGLARDFYKSYSLGLVAVEDGSLKIVKTPNRLKTAPGNMIFSPDGRYLIIDLPQSENDPKHDIFAFSVDGQMETRIAEHPEEDSVLEWIPGSNNLLFLSNRTGTPDAWLVGFAGGQTRGEPLLARKDLGRVTPLGLSREGAFFYRLGSQMTDIAIASIDLEERALIEPPKILPLTFVGANYQPQWSPDGKYLAYLSNPRSGPGGKSHPALWIRSADTGEAREITTNLQSIAHPCWAPDGRSLFVVGNDGKTFLGIYQVHVQTGKTTFFIDSEPGANIKFIAPARDGKSVYYTYFEFAKKRCRIMSLDLSTKEAREIYRQDAPPDVGGLMVSPDGKSLVFGTMDPDFSGVLKALPLPGGPSREIIKLKAGASGVNLPFFWAPDGNQIMFFMDASKGKDTRSILWSMPAEGGEPQSLGVNISVKPTSVSLHPDGRHLALGVSQPSAEVWVMENFLPKEKK